MPENFSQHEYCLRLQPVCERPKSSGIFNIAWFCLPLTVHGGPQFMVLSEGLFVVVV